MRLKFTCTFLCLFLITYSISLQAQNSGLLKGIVTDGSNKESIIGAAVYDPTDITHGVVTDVNGNYQLHLSPGKHKVVCSYVSMKTDSIIIVIDPTKTEEHNFLLKSEATQLQTMVVSAGKYEQKLDEITVSMEVIKPTLIENKNATNIKGVLEQTPGLNILDGEPQIRGGSGFNFGVGSRVAILIDGLPALAGDGGRLEWNFIPLENIEQVEIIKGASSVTYGSSALSGSINVRTAYAKDEPVTKLALSSGMYDAPSVAGSKWWKGVANFSNVSFLHSEKIGQLDLVIGGMGIYDHGFIGPPPASKPTDTLINNNQVGEKTGRLNFNLRYRPKNSPRLNFGINGNFMYSSNNVSLVWDSLGSNIYKAFPNTMTLQNQTIFYIDPFVNYYTASGWKQSFRTRYFYSQNDYGTNGTTTVSNNTNVVYSEYQVTKELRYGINITGGLNMNQTTAHSGVPYNGVLSLNHLQNFAGYAQVDKKLWKVLNVSVGFRDEAFKMNSEKLVSKPIFRSGLNLQVAKATYLRCSFGQGYRFTSITEKYIYSNIGGFPVFPNPKLTPESSWNAEVGAKQGFKINNFMGSIDAALFWQEYQNTIEMTYGTWGTVSQFGITQFVNGFEYLNTGPTRVRGTEVSLSGEGKITNDFKIDVIADYTFVIPQALNPSLVFAKDTAQNQLSYKTSSTDTTNNILKYRFQHIAKIDIQFTYKKYFIGGDCRYYSFMQNIDNLFYTPTVDNLFGIKSYRETNDKGTTIFDARIGMNVSKKFKAAFVVNNVLNLSYSLRPLKIEAPRTFAIRLSFTF
jgi:outer membrane cobalamin receptor